jgi:uncharacterized tellurite resistance protein B-like protein
MVRRSISQQADAFGEVQQVILDSLRFKRKLAIGEDAYLSMRVGKTLTQLWDVGGVAVTGGSIAASTTVAGTFFASSGWLATIGLGAAAVTPVGWVIGAALATGGAYYGVTRLFKSYHGSRLDVIPKFINTPIDLLGASLMDMLGALSFKIALTDGEVTEPERVAIKDYFITEWGYDPDYASIALGVLEENAGQGTIKEMTAALGGFIHDNPDCNFTAIKEELIRFLREIAAADGTLDEREEFAIEKVDALLREPLPLELTVRAVASAPGELVGLAGKIIRSVTGATESKQN